MKRDTIKRTVKVGFFFIIGLLIITYFIFYIGSKQQAFGAKKEVTVTFRNVSGLKTGNSIRFAGVTIGAVNKIKIISDSTVMVTLAIDANDSKFIKKDSKVSISTEGLLGSKYLSISPGSANAPVISHGDILTSVEPVDFEELLHTLTDSGSNFKSITGNVDQIVKRINSGEGMLGAIIADSTMDERVDQILTQFRSTGNNATRLTSKMIDVVDTLKVTGKNTIKISEDMEEFIRKLNNDSSSLGRIITDTIMANEINKTMLELKTTAQDVKETSASVRNSWFIRVFSKKKKK